MKTVIYYPRSRFKNWLLEKLKVLEVFVFLLGCAFIVFALGYGVGYKNASDVNKTKVQKKHK